MEEPGTIYFAGTAGAGKTSLVHAYARWLRSAGHDATIVNLDPGNEAEAGAADVDVREWVRLSDVMAEYDLGPNGAQVAAADMVAVRIFDIKQAIQALPSDYVLVDTPGQIELFAFRESSKAIVDALSGDRSLVLFLLDPSLARRPSGYASLVMLAATVEFRFRLPMLHLLSKSDLLSAEEREEIGHWAEPGRLSDAITAEGASPEFQLSAELFRALEAIGPLVGASPVSAKESQGLPELYRACQTIFAGAEDLEPSHAPTEE